MHVCNLGETIPLIFFFFLFFFEIIVHFNQQYENLTAIDKLISVPSHSIQNQTTATSIWLSSFEAFYFLHTIHT